jgi:transposase-like protein
VLESYVTKTRDKKAALKFLKKAMRRHGRPKANRAAALAEWRRLSTV